MRVADWLEVRTPPVPDAFREWMAPARPDARASVESLAQEAREAMDRALAKGRARQGAFDLLAADGFLTYACEAALESDAPLESLRDLMGRFTE